MSGSMDKDIVAGWQQVTQMNLKARLSQSGNADSPSNSNFDSLSNIPTVGYNASNTKSSDVIVLSDEEDKVDPQTAPRQILKNGSNTKAVKPIITTNTVPPKKQDMNTIRERLLEEERKLTVLRALKNIQKQEPPIITNGSRVTAFSKTHSLASVPIQGSALNKSSAKSRASAFESPRGLPSKQNIVVVPGNLKPSLNTSNTQSTSAANTGISSRLQQLVDNVAVDQALPSKKLSRLANSSIGKPRLLAKATTTKPPHEIITLSSVAQIQPPPLLSSVKVNSVQVPTISTTGNNPTFSSTKENELTESEKEYLQKVVQTTKRYKEFVLRQTHSKKIFSKQLERKILSASYPKTFRQVWPIIPVQDSSFIANFGLEAVVDYFKANNKPPTKTAKVKPICNQCSCDFASAWQIRKGNSKQILLCESCDFQNLKLLQRSKLSNQLKELLESVKKEDDQFNHECQESKQQFIDLEKQSILGQANRPPPLNSQLPSSTTATRVSVVNNNKVSSNSTDQFPVIPSILGQRLTAELLQEEITKNVRKRKDPSPAVQTPPSKSFKPGSALDQTLTKLSKSLIERKLDEQRMDFTPPAPQSLPQEDSVEVPVVNSPAGGVITTAESGRKKRRKGTPKHKRMLSASGE